MSGKIDKIISDTDKHESDVTCIKFFNNLLYSSGGDGKIKVCQSIYEKYIA